MRAPNLPLSMIAALCLTACATTSPIREYVDNDTAATVTVSGDALTFARERSDLAVHAQDYITITPLQINRSGQRTLYLYCQIWSTIDRRRDKSIVSPQAHLAIVADDRRIPLPDTATDIRRLGLGHPPTAEQHGDEVRVASIDEQLFRFLLTAGELRVSIEEDALTQYFTLWRDGRKSAREFLDSITTISRSR